MQYANDITQADTMSMERLRCFALKDTDLEVIRLKRISERKTINDQLYGFQGPPKYWKHPNSHLIGRYWGRNGAY